MIRRQNPWNDENDARLRELWAQGISGTAIGAAMGLTKNSIIGRAHRLKLPKRASPIPQSRGVVSRPAARAAIELPSRAASPSRPRAGDPRAAVTSALSGVSSSANLPDAVPITNPEPRRVFLQKECRFPLWGDKERPTHRYCGAAAVARANGEPSPFCEAHFNRCFTVTAKEAGPPAPMGFHNTKQRGAWRAA